MLSIASVWTMWFISFQTAQFINQAHLKQPSLFSVSSVPSFLLLVSIPVESNPLLNFSNKGTLEEDVKRVEISSTEFTMPIIGEKELAGDSLVEIFRDAARLKSSREKII